VFLLFGADPDLDLQTIEFKFMQFWDITKTNEL
jgi:hypothetical protein